MKANEIETTKVNPEKSGDAKLRVFAQKIKTAGLPKAIRKSGFLFITIMNIKPTKHCFFLYLKHTLDIIGSLFGLTLFSPMMLTAGILMKLSSPGTIIYKQKRVGKDGKIFKMYKLRTMQMNAEPEDQPVWAKRNDPRIIKGGGYFLRKYHIDELPQLFNVLKGEMSLVGPRPERPRLVKEFTRLIPGYNKRLSVRPGITGHAQIWHKYDETIRDVKLKLKYELLYIRRMCLSTDLKVVANTIYIILSGKDGYVEGFLKKRSRRKVFA